MDQIHASYTAARQNPVKAGLFAVFGVVALGVIAGFALGYDAPQKTWAALVTPIVVTPPVPVITPPTVPVIVPVVVTPVTPIVVTPPAPAPDTNPKPGTDLPTEVSPIVVTPIPDSDDHGDPCCTTPTTPEKPTPVTPVVVTPIPDSDDHGAPCCTDVVVTPPVVPPVVPPVIPPVVPPVIVDVCPNLDGIQPGLPEGYFVDENGNCVTRTTTAVLECVFLRATPTSVKPGEAVTLEWQTKNATSITIDNGVGAVTPVAAGTVVVHPTQTTTYKATVTGATGSVNCQTVVEVSKIPEEPKPAQCVFLNGTPSVINAGDPVRLEWKTKDATSIIIDNGIGQVLPTEEGFKIVNPTQTTTYKATVTGATGSVNCQTTVTVTTIQQGPQCVSLTADRKTIKSGEAVTLSWVISNATSLVINNGVGTQSGETGSVTVNPTSDTTYVASVPGAADNDNCKVDVVIEDTSCTSNCGGGGGGGGGRRSARVGLESFVPDLEEPLAFVYLSEVPYTGLELGTWGTILYWVMLVGWSLALAYLVLFNAVPFALARAKSFGGSVKEALNNDTPADTGHGHDAHAAPVAHAAHAPVAHGHGHAPAAPVKPTGYNAHDGFRSFAAGDGLTIDDIVKGLSREIEQKHEAHAAPVAVPTHEEVMQAVLHEETPVAAPAYVPAPAPTYQAPKPALAAAPMNADVRDFVAALLNGDRDTVFGMVRSMARQGQDTEAFVSHAACALDDAYRACIDGTTCHPDIAELTNGCHPSYLERLVSSLTTAVDGSYSAGMTGVKMALTRALGVVAG